MITKKIKALSLFANVGIAETYLKESNINICLSNELIEERVKFYKHLYPHTDIISGDISHLDVLTEIINKSNTMNIDLIIATPPCQGMSTAGKKISLDQRNNLIKYVVKCIKSIKPSYVFIENVPEQLTTKIISDNSLILIPDYLRKHLGSEYYFSNDNIVNASDYGVAQMRERAIFLLTRKDKNLKWKLPEKNTTIKTIRDVISDIIICSFLLFYVFAFIF